MGREEQGVRGQDRYLVSPRTLVLLFHGERVLLIQGAPDKRIWPGRYNGIGGHLEPGESLLEGARRELREEAGLAPARLDLCGIITVDVEPDRGVLVGVFRGEVDEAAVPHTSAEGRPEWVPLAAFDRLPLVPDLLNLIPRIHAWKPGDRVLVGQSWYEEEGELRIRFERD